MQSLRSRWTCDPYDLRAAAELSGKLGVSPVLGAVLCRRGLSAPEEARRFLAADDRHDPMTLPGARRAAEVILTHVERGSSIVVHGDYDVDGVCATAMLVRELRRLGARPTWELPSRFDEGYGLSATSVERIAAAGADLLVTVDSGITAVDEVAAARARGMDVVVTDHHRPGERVPDCDLVHPALGEYPTPELCASGVVLKLSEALRALAGRDPAEAGDEIALAALATVCDLVPLRGENRAIVRAGLESLARTGRPGLRALMRVAGLDPGDLTERSLAFGMGPRLNAAGRMRRADAALALLLTDDEARAEEVARELDFLNRDRRESETRILFAADAACVEQAAEAAMVVAGEGWHPGVVGIVASRLVERWHRPCVVIGVDGEQGRGSGRSIGGYDLHAGLSECAEHLRRFGGHRAAAGLELEADRIGPFRRELARHAAGRLSPQDLLPSVRVDAVVPGSALTLELAEELERLRPFGPGNPEPTLLVPAARLDAVSGMGSERQHARFSVVTGGSRSLAVAFGTSARSLSTMKGAHHDVALRLERNRWNGVVEPRAVIRALCPSRPGTVGDLAAALPLWSRVERELAGELRPWPRAGGPTRRRVEDRREAGCAAVTGDLLTSGARVLVAVADVPRRRAGLESLLAGLAPEALPVASWDDLADMPELAEPFGHVVALDPPPRLDLPAALPGPGRDGCVHLCWTSPDADFAREAWRHALVLRPALAEVWRRLRELEAVDAGALAEALRGGGRHPRSDAICARLVRVLVELRLLDYVPSSAGPPSCRVLQSSKTDLNRSSAYRAYLERYSALEKELCGVSAPHVRTRRPDEALALAAPA